MGDHKITAEVEISFHVSGAPEDENEVAYPTIEIVYSFSPGSPECRYQKNGDPGWPAEPDEISLISARLVDGDGLTPSQEDISNWAESWLDDEGYNLAIENANHDREPDPDQAYERMRDEPPEIDNEGSDYDY